MADACFFMTGEGQTNVANHLWLRELNPYCYMLCHDGRGDERLAHRLILHCPQCGGELLQVEIFGDGKSVIFTCDRCCQELYLPG